NLRFGVTPAVELNEGWSYRIDGGSATPIDSLPFRIETYENDIYSIEQVLSDVFVKQQQVLVRTSLANLLVKLDGTVIYEANFDVEINYASSWHIFEIPQDSEGKTLELVFSTPYSVMDGILNEIHYGYLTSLYLEIMSEF